MSLSTQTKRAIVGVAGFFFGPLLTVGLIFALYDQAYFSDIPSSYSDFQDFWFHWASGFLAASLVFLPFSRIRIAQKGFFSPSIIEALVHSILLAGMVLLCAFSWEVLDSCRKGHLFGRDGVVCLLKGVAPAVPVFLVSFFLLTSRWGWLRPLRRALWVLQSGLFVFLSGFLVVQSLPVQALWGSISGPSGSPRHILIYLSDTTRADDIGARFQETSITPRLDEFSSRAGVFSHAYSNSPWTVPSHASMFTGELPMVHGAIAPTFRLPSSETTLAEHFQKMGYWTIGLSENPWLGKVSNLDQGFARFESPYLNEYLACNFKSSSLFMAIVVWVVDEIDRTVWKDTNKTRRMLARIGVLRLSDSRGEITTDALIRLLERYGKGPFPLFIFVNVMRPHMPYSETPLGSSMALQYVSRERMAVLSESAVSSVELPAKVDHWAASMSESDVAALHALHLGEVGSMDESFGRIQDAIEELGIDDRILQVFVSDHGEEFNEHGLLGHRFFLYDTLIRVPLMIRCPWIPDLAGGGRYDAPVQLADLPKTLISALGLPEMGSSRGVGRDLLAALGDNASPPIYAQHDGEEASGNDVAGTVSRLDRSRVGVIHESRKSIVDSEGVCEVYDLVSDPEEKTNLFDPSKTSLDIPMDHLAWVLARREGGSGKTDPMTQRMLDSLGYIRP